MPVSGKYETEVLKPEIIHKTQEEGVSIASISLPPDPVTPIAPAPAVAAAIVDPAIAGAPLIPPPPELLLHDSIVDGGNFHDDDDHDVQEEVEEILFVDEFNTGFDVGTDDEKWLYFSSPPFVGNDGIESVSNGILSVRSSGTNAMTSEPEFTLTVPQEVMPTDTPGSLDHIKWLVFTNNVNAENSVPGYEAVPGKELICETWIRGQTFGTSGHPFGVNVSDPNDPRLAAFAVKGIDLETFMVFDFFLTNDKIYALYQRLPFGRTMSNNYASFTYLKEISSRSTTNFHHLEIAYDRARGTVRWLVDDVEVFKVTAIGKRLSDNLMTLNYGGDEPANSLVLNQLNCGLGHFTLLDAFLPSHVALVRLSTAPNFYFHPLTDAPLSFFDELSLAGNRLFGQGVKTEVKKFQVKYVSFE